MKYTVLQGLGIGLDEMLVARRIARFLFVWIFYDSYSFGFFTSLADILALFVNEVTI
jgi:hypothetical protein